MNATVIGWDLEPESFSDSYWYTSIEPTSGPVALAAALTGFGIVALFGYCLYFQPWKEKDF